MKSEPKGTPGRRNARLNRLLKEEISAILRRELKEDVAMLITITEVEVSADLSGARVYYSLFESDAEKRSLIDTSLKNKAGDFRGELGLNLHLKRIPRLYFIYDETEEKAADLESLFMQLKKENGEDA